MYAKSSNVKIFRGGVRALIACLIAFAVVFTQIKVEAFADTKKVRYYDRDANTEKEVSAEVVTEDLRNWGAAGETKWYVVKDNITQENILGGENKRIKVTGDVHLILADNAVLRANPGIEVSEGSSLTIYAQTAEVTLSTGKIIASIQGNPDSAAIGGNEGKACGTIKITGGNISAAVALDGAAIGGGKGGSGGTITITGGVVTAQNSGEGAVIGGGSGGSGGTITIDGGAVTASNHNSGAAIGGGKGGSGSTITINDGVVTASSHNSGAAIGSGSGGTITINGGVVNASATSGAAGIGGSVGAYGGTITINGGVVTANSNSRGAAIGGGAGGDGGTITITGGVVTARTNGGGAGIGGGGYGTGNRPAGAGGTVTISGGEVTATSTEASGIGGGLGEKDNSYNQEDGAPGSFNTGADGKAIIKTNSIADNTKEANWKGTIFNGNNGKVYGKQELTGDLEIEEGKTLTVPEDGELTIPSGKTLTNNGNLENKGKITNNGKINNNSKIKNAGTMSGNSVEGSGQLIEPHPTPKAVIDYIAEKLTGLSVGITYKITINGGSTEELSPQADGTTAIKPEWLGKSLSIKAEEDTTHLESMAQSLSVPARPAAPEGLEGVSETAFDKKDGKITGTTDKMQYMLSGSNEWKQCRAGEVSNLAQGKYLVRIAPVIGSGFASESVEVRIKHSIPFTAPKAKTNLSYTGEMQELITAGMVKAAIGNLQYSLTETGVYSTEIPKAKDAGSYEVYYKVVGTDNTYDYSKAKGKVTVIIAKANQAEFNITNVTGKKYGDADFAFTTTGGSGNGAVTFTVPVNNGVLSINGNTAKIVGAGKVTVKAVKAGDNNYNEISAELKITIAKAAVPVITFPTAGNLTYGQKLSESTLTGGSTEYGSFAWKNGNVIPAVNNSTGYEMVFTPNEKTKGNYEEIPEASMKKKVIVTVAKANPTVNLTTNVMGNAGNKTVMFTMEIEGANGAVKPSGNVKFSYKTGGSFTVLDTVALADGKATYKWENVADNEYEIKAEYVGDNNYSAIESGNKIDTRKKNQSDISFTTISNKTYGDVEFTLSITGGSGTGEVTYSVPNNNGVLSITGNKAKIIGAGTVVITAKKAADTNYNEADKSISITVAKKKLNVKAEDKTVVKGEAMPAFTYNKTEVDKNLASGDTFKNPDLAASVTNTNYTGEYEITVSGGELKNVANADVAKNYIVTYRKGKLTIVKALYEVKVINGTGSGKYSEGQRVNITANDRSGYTFTNWTSSDGVVFANASSKTTSFTMPAKAVTVTANYSANGGGYSGGGSFSGGSSSTSPKEENKDSKDDKNKTADSDKTSVPAKAEISVKAKKGKNKTATAKISEKVVENAIKKAKEEVLKNGKKADKIALELKVDMPKGTNKIKVNLTGNALERIVNEEVDSLTIDSLISKTVFDKKAVSEIKKKSKGGIVLSISPVKKLSKQAKKQIGKRPVLAISLSYLKGKKKITSLGKGKITAFIPYTLNKNEKADGLYAVYVDKKGKVRKIKGSYYDGENSAVVFTAGRLADFGIGYKKESK
ncbi:InlB B-repeat-containing protein [Catonella morbi]|nr:Ig-like domain repeat protein [Catonella morbi]